MVVHAHPKKTTPIILLDVYLVKYIAGVTMTPNVSSIEQQAAMVLPQKAQPIVTFCAVGGRSHLAAQKLQEMGYTTVLNAGGLQDLRYLQS